MSETTLKTTQEQREQWREQNRFNEITMDGSVLDMLLDDADTAERLQQENAALVRSLADVLCEYGPVTVNNKTLFAEGEEAFHRETATAAIKAALKGE